MTATLDETLAGHDMEGGEVFCDDLYNNLKNHWRANYGGDPCGSAGLDYPQPGMIISDEYDDRLYHITLVSGCPCSEILQACVPLSDDVYHRYGYDWDAMLGYDSTSAALILGLPLSTQRGMIICNVADIPHDFSALVPAVGLPTTFWSDADMDSFIAVGWGGDDLPNIWANRDLNIMYDAAYNVKFFTNAAAGENPYIYIYGWETGRGARQYTRFQMSDLNNEFIIESENNGDHEGITVSLTETNQRFRVRQNADYLAFYHDGTDGYMETNAGGGGLRFQYANAQDITFWEGIAAGNPDFYIYGYITTGAAIRYARFRMDDTYDEFLIEAEANVNHEGITVSLLEANQEFRLRGIGGAERFWIDQTGVVGYTRVGELRQWTYQGDLDDDASFTLPAFTDSCWGFIQAGDNEEYALFSVDNDGDVTLISNSANVVANADTDGKLVLGTAATQEPLNIRNRLGGVKNINLIIWYS